MGALRAAREAVGFSLSAGKVGGERASNKVFFSRGLKRHFMDCKEAAVTHLLHLRKSGEGKGDWQRGSREGRGECKT